MTQTKEELQVIPDLQVVDIDIDKDVATTYQGKEQQTRWSKSETSQVPIAVTMILYQMYLV